MQYSVGQGQVLHVVVVVAVRLYREGLAAALGARTGFSVLGAVGDAPAAHVEVVRRRPEVVIVDVTLPGALELIAELRRDAAESRIIAFAVGSASVGVIACAEAGAAGYVAADASIDQLVDTIMGVVSGELVCPPRVAFELFRRIGAAQPSHSGESEPVLTARERQVLQLLSTGLSNKEIARALQISVSTVKNHVHQVLEKTRAPSRNHVARNAHWLLANPEPVHLSS